MAGNKVGRCYIDDITYPVSIGVIKFGFYNNPKMYHIMNRDVFLYVYLINTKHKIQAADYVWCKSSTHLWEKKEQRLVACISAETQLPFRPPPPPRGWWDIKGDRRLLRGQLRVKNYSGLSKVVHFFLFPISYMVEAGDDQQTFGYTSVREKLLSTFSHLRSSQVVWFLHVTFHKLLRDRVKEISLVNCRENPKCSVNS